MTSYLYTITPTARISAGSDTSTGNVRHAHAILPGSTVRGALAAAWWRDRAGSFTTEQCAQDHLNQLFEGGLQISQAVPVVSGHKTVTFQATSEGVCKYPQEGCSRQPHDLNETTKCPQCKEPLIGGKGWSVAPDLIIQRTDVRLDGHGKASHGDLFSRESISTSIGPPDDGKTVHLTGRVNVLPAYTLDEEDRAWLTNAIRLRVGGRRTVLGAAQFTTEPDQQLTTEPDQQPPGTVSENATITVVSPTILVDNFGAPTTSPASIEAHLRTLLGKQVTLTTSRVRTTTVTGWHARAQLPRPADIAISPGSTWQVKGLPANAALKLRAGIGLRTNEGYGQVIIGTDPFVDLTTEPPQPNNVVLEPEVTS